MVQGSLIVSESGNDVAAFSGEVKDTASLLVISWNPCGDRTNSVERWNVPSFDFRDYNRVYVNPASDVDNGVLAIHGPISVVTWALPGGVRAKEERNTMYGHCVNLMLRF